MTKRLIAMAVMAAWVLLGQVGLDQYGGLTGKPSPNVSTGQFRLEKVNDRWQIVTPDNNAFFSLAVSSITATESASTDDLGGNYNARILAKYGNNAKTWGPAQAQRLKGWGFNTVGSMSSPYIQATTKSSTWWPPSPGYFPEPVPFFNYTLKPNYYAIRNDTIGGHASPNTNPVKTFCSTVNQTYGNAYCPPGGMPDYYDTGLYDYLDATLDWDSQMSTINDPANAKRKWFMAVITGEPDNDYLFGTGSGFATYPTLLKNHAHGGHRVAISSPISTAGSTNLVRVIYPTDTEFHSKTAWRDYLKGLTKYQTDGVADIDKLNAAWGATYTSWDSTGTVVTGESIGTGDGTTLTFGVTLANPAITKLTTQILVNGTVVAGDLCGVVSTTNFTPICSNSTTTGHLWGSTLVGTVVYSTGVLSVTFSAGNAPAVGAAITVNYVTNGWGIGTGLLDEDGRHTTWMGTSQYCMVVSDWCDGSTTAQTLSGNANYRQDADDFLYYLAKQYFHESKLRTMAHFNGIETGWTPLYYGVNLNYWNVPPNIPVLRAAGEELDLFGVTLPLVEPAKLNYIYNAAGDKPLMDVDWRGAQADSALYRYTPSDMIINAATQPARGSGYVDHLTALVNATYPNGSHPFVGLQIWKWVDAWSDKTNWGLVTLSDNAYDGHEATTGVKNCSAPLAAFSCTGEERNYGDYISFVHAGNTLVMEKLLADSAVWTRGALTSSGTVILK